MLKKLFETSIAFQLNIKLVSHDERCWIWTKEKLLVHKFLEGNLFWNRKEIFHQTHRNTTQIILHISFIEVLTCRNIHISHMMMFGPPPEDAKYRMGNINIRVYFTQFQIISLNQHNMIISFLYFYFDNIIAVKVVV